MCRPSLGEVQVGYLEEFLPRAVMHWYRLPGEVVGPPSLKVLQSCGDVGTEGRGQRADGDGLTAGLYDHSGLFQPQWFHDYTCS